MFKKGYMKTLEAVIAIILVLVATYTIIPRYVEPKPEQPLAIQDAQRFIVSSISQDDNLRAMLLTNDANAPAALQIKLQENIPLNYDFVCAICPKTSACVLPTPLDKTVYMNDIFVASTIGLKLSEQNPKIIRFWIWAKPTKDLQEYNICKVL